MNTNQTHLEKLSAPARGQWRSHTTKSTQRGAHATTEHHSPEEVRYQRLHLSGGLLHHIDGQPGGKNRYAWISIAQVVKEGSKESAYPTVDWRSRVASNAWVTSASDLLSVIGFRRRGKCRVTSPERSTEITPTKCRLVNAVLTCLSLRALVISDPLPGRRVACRVSKNTPGLVRQQLLARHFAVRYTLDVQTSHGRDRPHPTDPLVNRRRFDTKEPGQCGDATGFLDCFGNLVHAPLLGVAYDLVNRNCLRQCTKAILGNAYW